MTLPKCNLQDYLEIACMFHYKVAVTLEDGSTVTGIAQDVYSRQGTEKLVLKCGEDSTAIETTRLLSMTVLTSGARFSSVTFK